MKIITLFLIFSISLQAQDMKYASLNILSNSLIGGIGAGIHKKQGETFGHAFVGGVWKGAIGGAVCYTGKKMVQQTNINYVWTSRIIHSLGTSITYNASLNKKMLQSYSLPFYFSQIIFDGKLHCKVDLGTLAYTAILVVSKDMKFNLGNSIKLGTMHFEKKYDLTMDSFTLNNNSTDRHFGQTIGNAMFTKIQKTKVTEIVYENDFFKEVKYYLVETNKIEILKHEIIHSFQYFEANNINNFLKVKILHNKYVNINLNMTVLYGVNSLLSGYKNNIYEKGADNFSNYKISTGGIIKYTYK